MAIKRKPAIANIARPKGIIDDIIEPIVKRYAPKVEQQIARSMTKRRNMDKTTRMATEHFNKNPIKKITKPKSGNGISKEYKDYVLRNSKGDY